MNNVIDATKVFEEERQINKMVTAKEDVNKVIYVDFKTKQVTHVERYENDLLVEYVTYKENAA